MNATIAEANRLFEQGDFASALEMYRELMQSNEVWKRVLVGNYKICLSKLQSSCSGVNVDSIDWSLLTPFDITHRKKVLVTDFRYPRFDASAGELATYGIIKIFIHLGHDVVFIPKESTEFDTPYIRALRRLGVKCIENVRYENFKEKVLENSRDLYLAYVFRPDVARLCIPVIRATSHDAHIFYHAPDVYFRREKAQLNVESAEGTKCAVDATRIDQILLDEVYAALSSDHVVCVSDGDALALRAAMEDSNLNKSDLALPEISTFPVLYLERKAELPEFSTTKNICFVGSSEHHPNCDAIRWFLENVWERLSSQNPGLCFHVIGETNETEKAYYQQFKNVVVVGWVDSVEETLPNFKLTVAPLRFGAGIKGKVGTSLIVGVPCVASSVAVEDMGLVPDEEIILAATVDDYVCQITRLLNNEEEWLKLSRKGAAKAEQLYSHEATFQRFIRILNDNNVLDTEHYLDYLKRVAQSKKPINFPDWGASAEVDVSIIIPGFNNLELTRMCLTSIYFSMLPSDSTSYEIIYADDCSEANVIPELISKFGNLIITKTDANGGFVVNTNKGASVAKGKFLVLLNNDAVVLPAWLDGLLGVIQSTEKCHVAGSKMLNADAKLLEAGAGLWTDGRSCIFGRGPDGTGLDSTSPDYNYIREVDYVSFASVIIRKNAWDTLGGLSTEYGFGYYDDSDFCLEIRNRGGLVLFAPDSEVIHNESATFSKRNAKLVAEEKQRNSSLFRNKWANQLIHNYPYHDFQSYDPIYRESISKAKAARHGILTTQDKASNLNQRRHILYFSPFPSHPASHGNQTTIQKFGQFLQSEGHLVHFALMKSHMYSEKDLDDMAAAWDSFDLIKVDRFPSCDGNIIPFDTWYVVGLGEQIASLCTKYHIDTIICSYIFQSKLLDYVPSYILKIIDTHDKFTDRYTILDKLGKQREFFSCTQQEEGMYLSRADVVLARRDEEATYFDSISTAKVYTVPHIEDRAYLKKSANELSKIGMVASCNLINLDIVVSFIVELIRQQSGELPFEIHVAGEVKSLLNLEDPQQESVVSHPSVHFIGYVDDIRDFYESVDMIICPIMSGTGINVKTVQALAYGMPLLATRHASKGIPSDLPLHQFSNVSTLVQYLLSHKFEESELANLAKLSRNIYDKYIDWGYANFRRALELDQKNLREGIGDYVTAGISQLFSKKSEIANKVIKRKQLLTRDTQIEYIIESLEEYGPTWINLNKPLPNLQSNGGVGFWFRFRRPISSIGNYYLKVKGRSFQLHVSDDNLTLTSSIAQDVFEEPGDLILHIKVRFDWELPKMSVHARPLATLTLVCAQ